MKLNFQMEETPPLKVPQKLPFRLHEKVMMALAFAGVSYFLLSKFVLADEFDRTLRPLAGSGAVNLGRVSPKGDREEVRRLEAACVTAFEAKQPFRARFDTDYTDDFPPAHTYPASKGIVGTPDGKIYFIYMTGSDSHITKMLNPCPIVRTSPIENTTWIDSCTGASGPPPYDP